ncbi:MAG: class I SAM-dependent methyltransferase [Pseudomonadota bacterium]
MEQSMATNDTRSSNDRSRLALSEVKAKQQQTWAAGDYAQVGTTLQMVGEQLAESLDMRPGSSVLDVAAGNGNFALAAARRMCQVTAVDFVPQLLEKAKIRALAEGYDLRFQLADAESLPLPDNSFAAVGSVFGVMFTPDHPAAATELRRVCQPGGKIGLANWTPEGFIGQVFQIISRYRPNPLPAPSLWGTRDYLTQLFEPGPGGMQVDKRTYLFRHRSPAHWLAFFRAVYGPVRNAFAALAPAEQAGLETDLLALLHSMNIARDGSLKVPAEYLQIMIDVD